MSAAAWTVRRAKRDVRRGLCSRHVLRLRLSQIADLGWSLRFVKREDGVAQHRGQRPLFAVSGLVNPPPYDPGARVSVGDSVFEVIDTVRHDPVVLSVRHPNDLLNTYRIRAPRPEKTWLLIERVEA